MSIYIYMIGVLVSVFYVRSRVCIFLNEYEFFFAYVHGVFVCMLYFLLPSWNQLSDIASPELRQ